MENVLEQKKAAKRKRLLDAAYTLFQEKGAANTTINDIAKEAQVAKGTFYLYFRDKTEILDALVMQICHKVFRNACIHLAQEDSACLADRVVSLVDYILEYFKQDPLTLSVLRRNFTWRPVLDAELHTSDPVLEQLRDTIRNSPAMQGRTEAEIINLVYGLMEMVGSVAYAAIIEHTPDDIDNMKPVLYDIIRKAVS